VDSSGNEGPPSAEAALVPTDLEPPEPPARLTARRLPRGVELQWSPAAAGDLAGYVIYRAAYPGAPLQPLARQPADAVRYVDRLGQESRQYAVAAIDSSGNEGRQAIFPPAGDGP